MAVDGEREHTAQVTTEDGTEGTLDESHNVVEEATAEADARVGADTERQPEPDDGLELRAERALGAREPLGESSTRFQAERGREFTLGASFEVALDTTFETGTDVRFEERTERRFAACGQETGVRDEAQKGSTSGDGAHGTARQRTHGNASGLDLAGQPGLQSGPQLHAQGALLAVEPALETGVDAWGQAGGDTSTSAQAQTSGNVTADVSSRPTREEARERRTGMGAENRKTLENSSVADTFGADDEAALGGDLGASREVYSETGADVAGQDCRSTTIAPIQERCLQSNVNGSAA